MLLIMLLMLALVNRLAEGAIEEDVQVFLINEMVDASRNFLSKMENSRKVKNTKKMSMMMSIY